MSMYGDNSTKEWLYQAIESIRGEYENEMDFIADLAAILAEYTHLKSIVEWLRGDAE